MELRYGAPFRGADLRKLRAFLQDAGLLYDERVSFSACVVDDESDADGGEIIAAGSLDGGVLKCIAVSSRYQGEGVAARVVTALVREAARNGCFHLFVYTKPTNEELFASLGFYHVARTDSALLMENKRDGVARFVAALRQPPATCGGKARGAVGAIVANCDPFTNGHLYLIQSAAQRCDYLHVFIVSEDRGAFSADARWALVQAGVAHLPNVLLHHTGPYLISYSTFPDYFLKDVVSPKTVNAVLDIVIFAECFALPLSITHRFVGAEPFDQVTAAYNAQMKALLPTYGITLVELPRLESDKSAVSASRVRQLLHSKDFAAIKKLVPATTFEYLTR
jgi:[citrate (pro-3S)-lyase] ligase